MYSKSEELRNPYTRDQDFPGQENANDAPKEYAKLTPGIMSSRIMCMSINSQDDCVVFTTSNN